MLYKNTIFVGAIFQVFVWGIFLSAPIEAFAKTIYVEENGDDDNEGSSESPYKTLEKASEEVNEGEADEIRIGKGKFPGSVIFEQGVEIAGAGKGSTTLTGALTFKKKSEVEKLSIFTQSKNAITVGKNATLTVENVDIRDYLVTGIWISGGVVTVENSRIGGGAGKGIYAEAGSKLTLTGSSIVNNKQEGVDIRNNTRGAIKNNTIEGNKESGIELILGSSDFIISGNKIKNNSASGIAFQFYELKKKVGTITVTGNNITSNRKHGIDCNKPQAGDIPVGYWADSITLEENTFSSNKLVDISTSCKIIEAKTEEEKKTLEEELVKEDQAEAMVDSETPDAPSEEQSNQEHQRAEELVQEIERVINQDQYREIITRAERVKLYRIPWLWEKNKALENLEEQIRMDSDTILSYKEQLVVLEGYNNRTDLQERVTSQEQQLAEYKTQVETLKRTSSTAPYTPSEIISRVSKFIYDIIF